MYSTINTVPFATRWCPLDPNNRVNNELQCITMLIIDKSITQLNHLQTSFDEGMAYVSPNLMNFHSSVKILILRVKDTYQDTAQTFKGSGCMKAK